MGYHAAVQGIRHMPGQTLSMNQSQQLQMVLTPQLRQSLEMLQMPMMELRELIQQELDRNPTIEEEPATDEEQQKPEPEVPSENPATDFPEEQNHELDFEKEYAVLSQLDAEWREYFFQDAQNRVFTADDDEKRSFLLDSITQKESLQQHLIDQLSLAGLDEADQKLGELVIGSINDDGYLVTTLEELAASSNTDIEHLRDILAVVQDFHPTGVGARDLRECLLLQLDRMDKGESSAALIVKDHLDRLGSHKNIEIAKALHITPEDVQAAADFIATLDPKPGRIYSAELSAYVTPEVVVQKVAGDYSLIVNDDQLPHIRISKHYRDLLSDKSTPPDVRAYVQERIRSGAFLIKSIHQRQKTIHLIATEIIAIQKDFLDHGIAHLRPLTMAEVARKVGFHETTVSRTVSGKYMKTPVGTFNMKYFFTPGIKTADGGQMSNKAVKDLIMGLVSDEDSSHPLSDQEIMDKLKSQGVQIARRTVAKYRIVLRIPPSHMRKLA
jgi:RNA polymerase sigma-54 factor